MTWLRQLVRSVVERFRGFVLEVKEELLKVTYPSRTETLGSTSVVMVFVAIVALFLAFVDLLLVRLVSLVLE